MIQGFYKVRWIKYFLFIRHADIYHHDIEKDVDLAKEVHDIEDNDNDDELEATVLSSTEKREISLKETVTIEDVKDKKYLLSQTCLLVLLSKVQLACNVKGCKKLVKFSLSEHGSAVAVTWVIAISTCQYCIIV